MELNVYHHLGLGDHIICNALVRSIQKKVGKVHVFAKNSSFKSIEYMYRDNQYIQPVPVVDDQEAHRKLTTRRFYKIGFEAINKFKNTPFNECFYKQVGLDPKISWDNFYIERDTAAEHTIFAHLNPNNEKYVFVHDDPVRNFSIDTSGFNKKIIRPENNLTDVIFHYMELLEKADEIHCIDSAFLNLADRMNLTSKLVFHKYAKQYIKENVFYVPSLKSNWTILNTKPLT